jgi:hypothetical protein
MKNNKEGEIKSVMSNKILDEFDNISLKKWFSKTKVFK